MPRPDEHNLATLSPGASRTGAPIGATCETAATDVCEAVGGEDIFEAAGCGMAQVDPATNRFVRVNRKFCQQTGRSAGELLGLTFRDITHPDDRAVGQAMYPRLLAGEVEEFAMNKRYLRPDGSVLWVQAIISLLRDKAGWPWRMLGVIQEIDDLKRQEEELRRSEESLRQALSIGRVMTFEWTVATDEVIRSETAGEVLGLGSEAMRGAGRDFLAMIHPDDRERIQGLITEMYRHPDHRTSTEFRLVLPDGSLRWVNETAQGAFDSEGRFARITGLSVDITERRQAEEELRQSEERLRLALGAAFAGMWDWNILTGAIIWSPENYDLYGIDPAQGPLQYTDWEHNIHPDDLASANQAVRDALEHRRPEYRAEYRILHPQRGLRWVLGLGRVEFTPDGTPRRMSGLNIDITEHKRMEEALRASEQRFRALFDHSPDAVFLTVPDGRIMAANPAACGMFGMTESEICQAGAAGLAAPEDPAWAETIRDRQRKGQISNRSLVYVRKNGERFVGETRSVILPGLPSQAFVVVRDITERKRAEEAMRHSEEQFRLLVENQTDLVVKVDTEGRLLFVSASYCRMFGKTEADLLGRNYMPLVHEEDRPATAQAVEALYWPPHTVYVEQRAMTVHGWRWLAWIDTALLDKDGRVTAIIGLGRDITEKKQAEEELRNLNDALSRANAKLAEADRRKDEFLAMLAHELRNPLAPVRHAVQILNACCHVNCTENERMIRQRQVIDRQVTHMSRLLDDLLDVSRVTRGTIELKRRRVALGEVLARAVEAVAPLLQARRHTLHFSPPPADLRVDGDFDRLIQVVGNLLANAAKYTDPGGRIWLDAAGEGSQAVMRVRDTGLGLAPEMLGRIFELFTQADASKSREQGGLGIGLTMVKKLVELHGGTVEACSAGLGRGSEFIVRLPALADAPETVPIGPAQPSAAPRAARSGRVLVVDDVEDSAASLAELLEVWGHETQVAHDGPSALEAVRAFGPGLVLLDIGMPGMDGHEVARRLRLEHGPSLCLVALTGYGQAQDREATRVAGFDHHLVKPVDLATLRDLLGRVMS